MRPKFIYFDLGKVLVDFDLQRMFRQMAAAAGRQAEDVRDVLYNVGIQRQYELGRFSSRQFHAAFCEALGCQAEYEPLLQAGCDIFTLNTSMLPVVAQLARAGYRLGILSNTCDGHWEYCRRRYRLLDDCFEVHALSHRIGASKPEAAIFHAAAQLAGVAPTDIFFTDDIAEHVVAARAVGFDAEQYTSTPALVAALRARGVALDY